jgi:acyl carrier protein
MNKDKANEIISRVLGIEAEEIHESLSPDTSDNWDSLATMHLIVAIEDSFDIRLSTSEVMEITSVGSLYRILEKRI